MARAQLTNNAVTTLAADITNVATSLTVAAGTGAKFPSSGYFYVTLLDSGNIPEIVKVTSRAVDVLTIVRAQDGTSARAFSASGAGTRVSLNLTAVVINELAPIDNPTFTGTVVSPAFSGPLTGAVTGNVTGNLTGNVTGNLTGNVTGNTTGIHYGSIDTAATAITKTAGTSDTTVATTEFTTTAVSAAVPTGTVITTITKTAPTGYLKCNGAAVSRTTYAALFAALYKQSTVTMTIATPGVITWNAHGLSANDPVQFTSTGVLPTGFLTGTTYYVVGASITTNTFQLSATSGGTAINTTGSQSGVHTAHSAPYGVGDLSTTFNLPDLRGEFVRGFDDGKGTDSGRALGSAQAGDIQSHTHGIATPQNVPFGSGGLYYAPGAGSSATSSATGGTETRPRNIALLYCIKT